MVSIVNFFTFYFIYLEHFFLSLLISISKDLSTFIVSKEKKKKQLLVSLIFLLFFGFYFIYFCYDLCYLLPSAKIGFCLLFFFLNSLGVKLDAYLRFFLMPEVGLCCLIFPLRITLDPFHTFWVTVYLTF